MAMAVIGILTCLVCWLKQTNKMSTQLFSLTILASLYGLFMFHAFSFAHHPAQPDYFEEKCYLERQLRAQNRDMSKLENLGGERCITLYIAGLLQPNNLESGDAVQKTIDHYQLSRQMLAVSTHTHQHYGSSSGYLLSETADYRNLFVDVLNKSHISGKKLIDKEGNRQKTDLPLYRVYQITSTGYVMGMIDKFTFGRFSKTGLLDPKLFDLWVEDPSWNARIYRVKEPMPHVYLSYRWQWLDSQEKAIQAIVDAEKSGFDPWKETLLEIGNLKPGELRQPDVSPPPASSAELNENSPNQMNIETTSAIPALLVLTDHYYPGWVASVDGNATPILRANAVLRAVFVPAGKHQVQFKYEPRSLTLALAISIAASIILLAVAIVTVLMDKRRYFSS